jgi:hypothetical protein
MLIKQKKREKSVMFKSKAPSHICIYSDEHRSKTLSFLNEIHQQALFYEKKILVDLTEVKFASAAASTLMFAIVNRAQLVRGDANSIRFILPSKGTNPTGHLWIVGTGLSKALLSGSLDRLAGLSKNEQYFQSAVKPHEHYQKTVTMLDNQADLSLNQFLTLSSAISEAMLNVSHHAYKNDSNLGFVQAMGGERWWQCAWFNPVRDEVVFIICDLGIGIGESYKSGHDVPIYSSESDWVLKAYSYGGTRFANSSERGNGSEDIKRPIGVIDLDNESLLVFSGKSKYKYTSEDEEAVCSTIPEHIPGTLVQWSLKRGRG